MKTKLLLAIAALAAAACGADSKTQVPANDDGTIVSGPRSGELKFGPPSWIVAQVRANGDFVCYLEGGAEFFSVRGFKQGERPNWSTVAPYLAPEKAAEISANLTTRDGRQWRAEWKEVKP